LYFRNDTILENNAVMTIANAVITVENAMDAINDNCVRHEGSA